MPIPSIEVRSRGPRGTATITKFPDTVDVTFDDSGQTLSFSRHDPEAIGFDVEKIPFPAPSAPLPGEEASVTAPADRLVLR
jgi:hypothetical protein